MLSHRARKQFIARVSRRVAKRESEVKRLAHATEWSKRGRGLSDPQFINTHFYMEEICHAEQNIRRGN